MIAWPSWAELEVWFAVLTHRAHAGVGVAQVEIALHCFC
jgi:hypothetical protein